MSPHFKLRNP